MSTSLENRVAILAELITELQGSDEPKYAEFADFVKWHNISFPVANLISMGIFQMNPEAEKLVNSGFDRFLEHLGKEDLDYESLQDLVGY